MYLGARFVFNSEFSFQNNPKLVIPMLVMFVCLFVFFPHMSFWLTMFWIVQCICHQAHGSRELMGFPRLLCEEKNCSKTIDN